MPQLKVRKGKQALKLVIISQCSAAWCIEAVTTALLDPVWGYKTPPLSPETAVGVFFTPKKTKSFVF
jgi:hypothetical protein